MLAERGIRLGTGTVGIANAGLNRWGIAVRKGQMFEGRLYLRGSGDVVVALQSADGTKEYASQRITGIGAAWKKFPFELTAAAATGMPASPSTSTAPAGCRPIR